MTERRRYENIKMTIEIPTEEHIKANFEGCDTYAKYGHTTNICRYCPNREVCQIIFEKLHELASFLNLNEVKE